MHCGYIVIQRCPIHRFLSLAQITILCTKREIYNEKAVRITLIINFNSDFYCTLFQESFSDEDRWAHDGV